MCPWMVYAVIDELCNNMTSNVKWTFSLGSAIHYRSAAEAALSWPTYYGCRRIKIYLGKRHFACRCSFPQCLQQHRRRDAHKLQKVVFGKMFTSDHFKRVQRMSAHKQVSVCRLHYVRRFCRCRNHMHSQQMSLRVTQSSLEHLRFVTRVGRHLSRDWGFETTWRRNILLRTDVLFKRM